jgi:predicted permease
MDNKNRNFSDQEDRQGGAWSLNLIWTDIRYAFRQFRKSRVFAITAMLTLGLGIGANTAVFSLIDTVLLHPLPYQDPGKIVLITETLRQVESNEVGVAAQEARDYASNNRTFTQMAMFESEGFDLTGNGAPMRVNAAKVSQSTFSLLGVPTALGRTFTEKEDLYGSSNVAVISWSLWHNRYGGNASVLGSIIRLNETPYEVIGVMPSSFRFPFDGKPFSEMADIWVPEAFSPQRLDPNRRVAEFGVGLIGRLKPGVTIEAAQADIASIAERFQREHPDVYSGATRVYPKVFTFAAHSMTRARALTVLLGCAVALVLLICCANVSNLLLARASRRASEMAVRAAIGATRTRLICQCIVENLALSLCGGVAGVMLAAGIQAGLRNWGPRDVPRLHEIHLNWLVLAFAFLLSLATGILFGLVPAWKISRVALEKSLRESGKSITRGSQQLQDALAISEVALGLLLIIGSGLLVRSFVNVVNSPLGFDPNSTFVVRTMFDRFRYPEPPRRYAVQHELLDRLSRMPGVTAVGAASHLPLSDERQIAFRLEGSVPTDYRWVANSLVTPGYFRAMGIAMLQGRDFGDQDKPDSPPVAIVSQAFIKQYLQGQDPIGMRFITGRGPVTIVGVVGDVRINSIDSDPPATVYNSMFQVESGASGRTALVVRTGGRQPVPFSAVAGIVNSLDSGLPLYQATSLSDLVSESLASRRFTMLLLGGFAAIAILLAILGLFGVLTYLVGQREREISVRMAVGATRSMILRMIAARGIVLGITGCVVGLLLSVFGTTLLRASLFHVSRLDIFTFVGSTALLLIVVFLSTLIPALRAASTDPIRALRNE